MLDDRAQSFTLEGFMSAMVLLVAVLFALQSTVLTSTSGGSLDAETESRLGQEATDVLAASATDGELSAAVRYWDSDGRRFADAIDCTVGYGANGLPDSLFGGSFARAFGDRGFSYNVVVSFRDDGTKAANAQCVRDVSRPPNGTVSNSTLSNGTLPNGTREIVMLSQGRPTADAVTARYTVSLYDNQTLTAPGASTRELWEYDTDATDGDGGFYPIPDAAPDSPLYNVVEVRIVVW